MPADDDARGKIIRLMKDATEGQNNQGTPPSVITVSGNGNAVAGRDVIQVSPVIRQETKVTTGDGVVSAAQKARIQQLIKDWLLSHNAVKARPLTFQAAYSALNKRFKVNSYHELPGDRFDDAVKWLQQQRARIQNMRSAPKKDPTVASSAIRYIKARCKNDLGNADLYRPYILKTFGASSLADLDASQLQRVRGWVSLQKPIR